MIDNYIVGRYSQIGKDSVLKVRLSSAKPYIRDPLLTPFTGL